jgi:hypothetical protein
MEFQGMVECVVCPALVKKAKKKLKAQKKLEKESGRLESEINRVRSVKAKEIEFATIAEQKRHEEIVKREKERMEVETKERELRMLHEKETDQARRLQIIESEKQRVAALEAEQVRLVQDARTKAELQAQELAEQAKASAMQGQEDQMKLEEIRKVKALSIEEEHAAVTQKRKEMENKNSDDSKRLEEMEQRRRMGLATALESMNRDVLVAEHRRRLAAKAKLDLQIARLEEDIMSEELETKTVSDEKRAEDETRMIALLEQEAAEKAKAAEEAIRKAKAALEHVHSARREVIAQTIALAEQEAVAEAESIIKQEREDYKAPVILPSDSEINRENWETLRTEGRSVMTRRVMAGWVLLSEFCQGVECHSSPLITKDAKKECCVCGGCGDGTDGAYIAVEDYDVVPTDEQLQAMRESGVMPDGDGGGYEITRSTPRPISPTAGHTFEQIQQDFETKRNMVSREIGKRMVEAWTLLDTSCPHCVMPLMMDPFGNTDVCVLCGLVNTIQDTDGSTIKTVDVPTKTVPAGKAPTETHATEDAIMSPDVQTQVYTDDAETMYTTIATFRDTVVVEPNEVSSKASEKSEVIQAVPAPDKKEEHPRDDLTQSIRQNTQRQQPVTTAPRSDPPASSKPAASNKRSMDPDATTTSLAAKSSSDDDKYTTTETLSKEMSVGTISSMIMGTAAGQETTLVASMSKDEVKDLVDIYVATSLSGNISEEVKSEVVEDLQRKLDELAITPVSPASQSDGVIHLENVPSPQNFKFDMVPFEDVDNASRKQRPSPEVMGRPWGMPPRPDSTRGSPRKLPRSTTSRSSPHNGNFVITGGPSDVTSLGEMSRAESVATDALDSILDRIDAAKATLLRDDITVREQLEAANLIEKLAQAAVAVKALERIGH